MTQRTEWIEPGAFQVAPGVHRIPLPLPSDGLRAVNVYAITGEDGLVLIDGGWALEESRRQLEAALKELGHGLGDITRFLVTHVHRDHYTQAVAVRREFGTRVSLGIGERPTLELLTRPVRREDSPQLARLLACGAGPLVERLKAAWKEGGQDRLDWEMPDDWIDGRTAVPLGERELLAVPTPGHTRGHLVFADLDAGLMFAGDHVLPHITPSIGFESAPDTSPLGAYLDSLRIVREMPDLRLLPAHGPVTDSVHARVDALLEHHAERLDASEAAVTAGSGTAYETARALTWTRRGRAFDDLDLFNQMLATTETQAHLEVLVTQGRLRGRADGDGVTIYETP
ncbi:MBL fold metallo-hydrolase [Actinoallomurus liliacearum]|uniref:MBL fold metallo-hydrolase n=1 Tax=Actinoallomurus liliacearum TaxID=1080073 RepID=A0ABP8TLF9_9ACTN